LTEKLVLEVLKLELIRSILRILRGYHINRSLYSKCSLWKRILKTLSLSGSLFCIL